jgi:hypothetical protein
LEWSLPPEVVTSGTSTTSEAKRGARICGYSARGWRVSLYGCSSYDGSHLDRIALGMLEHTDAVAPGPKIWPRTESMVVRALVDGARRSSSRRWRKHPPTTVPMLKEEQCAWAGRLPGLDANVASAARRGASERGHMHRRGRGEPLFHLVTQGLHVRLFHLHLHHCGSRKAVARYSENAMQEPSIFGKFSRAAPRVSQTTLSLAPMPSNSASFSTIATGKRLVEKCVLGRTK